MSDHPECDKVAAVAEQSQAIGEFLEWLPSKGLTVATHYCLTADEYPSHVCSEQRDCCEMSERFVPLSYQTTKLLAEFFDIDLAAVDREQRAMLDQLRAANA